MSKKMDYVFYNEMKGLPLLNSYICSFESMSGEAFDPELGDNVEGLGSRTRLVLTEAGELVCRSGLAGESAIEIPVQRGADFRLAIRSFPHARATRIPFFHGRVCEELEKWEFSQEKLIAQIVKKVPSGFLVYVLDSPAFLPISCVGANLRENLDVILDKVFECEVVASDGKHPPVVSPTGPFISFDDWFATP